MATLGRDRYKTVSGINGMNLNKHLEFIFGEKAIKYYWNEEDNKRSFTFYMRYEVLTIGKAPEFKKRFEEYYCVKIKPFV